MRDEIEAQLFNKDGTLAHTVLIACVDGRLPQHVYYAPYNYALIDGRYAAVDLVQARPLPMPPL